MNVLSLFSGCGGMEIGFEGGFTCLKKSINTSIHSDWIKEDYGEWIILKETNFHTVFANDIRPDAKAAWVSYFEKMYSNANEIYKLESIVDLVKKGSQFIIATHSPILLGYRDARIINLDDGMHCISYKETNIYNLYKRYLDDPISFQNMLFIEEEEND